MELPADFFAEFPPVSKAEWLARIAKDLKGKPLDDLYWQIGPELRVDPFGHADDFAEPPAPLSAAAANWEISEDVDPSDPMEANAQALEALEFGADGLRFWLPKAATTDDLRQRLNGIYLDFIGLHFAGPGLAQNPGAVFAALEGLARESKLDPRSLRGSLAWDLAEAPGLQDWRYLADLGEYARDNFPQFGLIMVDGIPEFRGPEHVADELAALLRRGNFYLKKLSERGGAPAPAQIQFSVATGKSYFLEIAKLRAFNLLWLNVLQAWGLPPSAPMVEARFAPEAYDDDLHSNLIRATTMAMSAVLGGAQRLTVRPYDVGREQSATGNPPAFGRRMARNVQHLLKMESFFAEINDPAAGSYYLEKLTAQLAASAWAKFQAG